MVSSGANHILVLTGRLPVRFGLTSFKEKKDVYGLGVNGYGQLGIEGASTLTLTLIPHLSGSLLIACGFQHSIAVDGTCNYTHTHVTSLQKKGHFCLGEEIPMGN